MKLVSGFALIAAALLCQTVFADLPTRTEQLDRQFQDDRARGLIALNERYVADFQKELAIVMKAGNLEEANSIKAEIQKLVTEISELKGSLENLEEGAEAMADDESLLEGKTIMFPHNTKPEELVGLRFLENGEAVWIGLGGREVEREFRKMDEERKFFVWWPARGDLSGYEVTVSEDGKTAEVVLDNGTYKAVAEIKRTR